VSGVMRLTRCFSPVGVQDLVIELEAGTHQMADSYFGNRMLLVLESRGQQVQFPLTCRGYSGLEHGNRL
jgi:hypothetical protein